jgi:uncharacterized protein YndB with AHSA1/START domain
MPKSFVAEQSYQFRAAPSKVFAALTDPEVLVKWFLSHAEVDPAQWGAFRFGWIGGYRMTGVLLQYRPPKAVSFLWTDKLPNGKVVQTQVAFRIVRSGKGTVLKLRHSGFVVPEHYAECASRWAYYLTNLKSVLDHGVDLRSKLDW